MVSISPQARRIALICLAAVLAVMYGISWFSPAIGLAYTDGAALTHALTPPLFPLVLGLFAAVSRQPQWLKLLPLACTVGWLLLTRRLLLRMGASRECSWMLIAMTAASPTVRYLATNLFAESLFALLITASLLALLDEKALAGGVCAGLATMTLSAGGALVVAALITFVATRRLRSAAVFTFTAMVFAAPSLGWSMAHGGVPVSKLHLNEFGVLMLKNLMWLAAAPFTLLSGYANLYPGLLTAVALLIVLIRRRLFIPDLFFGFYCVVLLLRTEPPLFGFAPILPMFLWILWRVARSGRFAVITKAVAVVLIGPALWFGAVQLARPAGWSSMEKLFGFIRTNTPSNAVLLADLDPVFTFNTGRKTVRGFIANSYGSYYAPPAPLVTPDELRASVIRDHVGYVVLTPDVSIPESASFHSAVAALERGGVLEPVDVPGVPGDYRVLKVR